VRLAVVSDIHGNLPALQAVVADVGAVDGWLNLGDIVSGPLWPSETADWLMAQRWPTIAGNHERQVLWPDLGRMGPSDRHAADRLLAHHRTWLASLPPRLDLPQGLVCVHGTPRSDLVYLLETPDAQAPGGLRAASAMEVQQRLAGERPALLLCGHSHVPRELLLDEMRIVNPGSVGLQAYDDDQPHAHAVENGSPHARYAIVEHRGGRWHVALRAVGYDWEQAALQAETNGRGDWADALRTGRVGRREAEVVRA